MNLKNAERFMPYAGIAAPIFFIILVSIAIWNYPGYSPTVNYMSDLGVGTNSAIYFNSALAITGILGSIFGHSITKKEGLRVAGQTVMVGSVFLILVGIFTLASSVAHYIVALTFFTLMFVSMILTGVSLLKKNRKISYFSFAMAALVALMPVMNMQPFPEHIAIGAIMLWVLVMAKAIQN